MFDLFKTKLTAQELHKAIILYDSELLANIETFCNRDAEQEKVEIFEQTGFVSTQDYGLLTGKDGLCGKAEDIRLAKRVFPKALFVRKADFVGLLNKYKLVCGMAKDYTGNIPYKNLREVKETLDIIKGRTDIEWRMNQDFFYVDSIYASKLKYTWDINDNLDITVFPFSSHNECVYKGKRVQMIGSYLLPTDFLIAAPAKFINHKIKNFRHELLGKFKSRISDPIVFQILPHDLIMIHTMWGDEADDPIFKDKNKVL